MHSFIIASAALLLSYIFDIKFLEQALVAYILHLILDLITHKDYGPRFLWPISDKYTLRGVIQWDKKISIIIIYTLTAVIVLAKYMLLNY